MTIQVTLHRMMEEGGMTLTLRDPGRHGALA